MCIKCEETIYVSINGKRYKMKRGTFCLCCQNLTGKIGFGKCSQCGTLDYQCGCTLKINNLTEKYKISLNGPRQENTMYIGGKLLTNK